MGIRNLITENIGNLQKRFSTMKINYCLAGEFTKSSTDNAEEAAEVLMDTKYFTTSFVPVYLGSRLNELHEGLVEDILHQVILIDCLF